MKAKRTHWRTIWKRVADLIERGLAHPLVVESRHDFLTQYYTDPIHYYTGALGAGVIGKFDNPEAAYQARSKSSKDVIHFAANALRIPARLAERINDLHRRGISVKEIAARLRRGRLADS